jgi:replication factor C small subunit
MILLTSNISSVIDPILSRCTVFFFNRIDQNSFAKLLDGIAVKEGLTFKGNISKILYNATGGKIGESINILQKSANKSKIIGPDEIYRMISNDFQEKLNILTKNVLNGKTENIEKNTRDLFNTGFDFKEIIQGICEEIFNMPLTEPVRAGIINVISDADFNAVNLTDEKIHLDNLLYRLIAISHAEKEFRVKL